MLVKLLLTCGNSVCVTNLVLYQIEVKSWGNMVSLKYNIKIFIEVFCWPPPQQNLPLLLCHMLDWAGVITIKLAVVNSGFLYFSGQSYIPFLISQTYVDIQVQKVLWCSKDNPVPIRIHVELIIIPISTNSTS